MSARAIIYDCDGMLNHETRFSERLAAYVPLEISAPFFRGDFQRCLIGDLDLKDALETHVHAWHWGGSVEDLLSLWFSDAANSVDAMMLSAVDELRSSGIRAYLATNNERYRTEYLLERRGLGSHFDAVFASYLVGAKKPERAFYEYVFSHIPESREDVLYWDDDSSHVQAAHDLGFRAYLYTDLMSFRAAVATS